MHNSNKCMRTDINIMQLQPHDNENDQYITLLKMAANEYCALHNYKRERQLRDEFINQIKTKRGLQHIHDKKLNAYQIAEKILGAPYEMNEFRGQLLSLSKAKNSILNTPRLTRTIDRTENYREFVQIKVTNYDTNGQAQYNKIAKAINAYLKMCKKRKLYYALGVNVCYQCFNKISMGVNNSALTTFTINGGKITLTIERPTIEQQLTEITSIPFPEIKTITINVTYFYGSEKYKYDKLKINRCRYINKRKKKYLEQEIILERGKNIN